MKEATPNQIRLETLYRQKLVRAESTHKRFPWEHLLKKELGYWPQKPLSPAFDVLEIGPGRGDFLFHLCESQPTQNIVAVELGGKRYHKLVERAQEHNLKNLTLVHGDARLAIMKDLAEVRYDRIYVLFPDPWPRNGHRHRRLLQKDFLLPLLEKLNPGGVFTLVTDVEDYATWALSNSQEAPGISRPQAALPLTQNLPELVQTYFEQKWRKMGRGVWAVQLTRVS
jgi:tRNA (guanine-N7-)-methyltransferase